MKTQFYCQNVCGEIDFSIDEWNEAYAYCNEMGIEGKDRDDILNPPACEEQCFDCMAIVGDRRKKTKELKTK